MHHRLRAALGQLRGNLAIHLRPQAIEEVGSWGQFGAGQHAAARSPSAFRRNFRPGATLRANAGLADLREKASAPIWPHEPRRSYANRDTRGASASSTRLLRFTCSFYKC